MSDTVPTCKFTSWDGLEEDELETLRSQIAEIKRLSKEIDKRAKSRRNASDQKRQKEQIKGDLIMEVRAWRQRRRPTASINTLHQGHEASLVQAQRTKMRKMYDLVQYGLLNPVLAKGADFKAQLRAFTTLDQVDATNAVPNPADDDNSVEVKHEPPSREEIEAQRSHLENFILNLGSEPTS